MHSYHAGLSALLNFLFLWSYVISVYFGDFSVMMKQSKKCWCTISHIRLHMVRVVYVVVVVVMYIETFCSDTVQCSHFMETFLSVQCSVHKATSASDVRPPGVRPPGDNGKIVSSVLDRSSPNLERRFPLTAKRKYFVCSPWNGHGQGHVTPQFLGIKY